MKNNNYSPNVKRQLSNNWFQIALVSVVFMILYFNSSSFHLKIDSAELNSASSSSPSHTNIARAEFPILSLFSFEKETAFNWKKEEISDIEKYCKRFVQVAQTEQKKYHIPASFILAVAIMESQIGKSETAQRGNNHFSLQCSSEPKVGEKQLEIASNCFKYYDSAWASFRDFSLSISNDKEILHDCKGKNYNAWCVAYCNQVNKNRTHLSASQLIELIEILKLNQIDA